MTTLSELAGAVEGLEGPNYAIEVKIFKAIHPEYAGYVQGRGGLVHPCDGSDQRVLSDVRPGNYTASIDAAMTLVPKGWGWLVSQPNAKAIASGLLKERTPVLGEVQYGIDHRHTVAAATPALTLCAAALRARASGEGA